MKRLRIIIDTNVLVSGLRSQRGTSHRLLSLLDSDRFVFALSVPLVVEYEKALRDPNIGIRLSREDIGRFIDSICALGEKRKIHFLWRPRLRDPKDDMVLEIGVAAQCDYIVTFNGKDFKGADTFGIRVVTPKEFLTLLGG